MRDARLVLHDYLLKCKENRVEVLLCLSGGSALELLPNFDSDVLGNHVTIVVLDERFSKNPEINNLAQIEKTGFIEKAVKAGCEIIDTKPKNNESIEELAAGFNMALVRWIGNHPGGKIVATAGLGPDGHTSGIIPESANFDEVFMVNTGRMAVGYKAANQPEDRNLRVTTTFEFLRMIAFAVLIVMGDKQDALDRLNAPTGELKVTPARIWRETVGNVRLFTDLKV